MWKKKGLTWNNGLGHRFDHIFGGISGISGIYGTIVADKIDRFIFLSDKLSRQHYFFSEKFPICF